MTIPPTRYRRWPLVLALSVITVAAVSYAAVVTFATEPSGAEPSATQQSEPEEILRMQGARVAKARASGGDDVALLVNDYPVTAAVILEMRAQAAFTLSTIRDQVRRAVPDDDPSLRRTLGVADTDIFYDGKSPIPESAVRGMKPLLESMEKYGADVMALAGAIAEYAYLTAAIEGGYSISDAEVEARVHEFRRYFDMPEQVIQDNSGSSTTIRRNHELDGYIAEVGLDRYWSEILPAKMWRQYTTASWRLAALQGVEGHEARTRVIDKLHRSAISNVEIKMTGELELNATVEEALAYLIAYLDWGIAN